MLLSFFFFKPSTNTSSSSICPFSSAPGNCSHSLNCYNLYYCLHFVTGTSEYVPPLLLVDKVPRVHMASVSVSPTEPGTLPCTEVALTPCFTHGRGMNFIQLRDNSKMKTVTLWLKIRALNMGCGNCALCDTTP